MSWENKKYSPRPASSHINKAMMKHSLVPLKILCIQGLGKNISHLIMGPDVEHIDSPNAHLLFSKVV